MIRSFTRRSQQSIANSRRRCMQHDRTSQTLRRDADHLVNLLHSALTSRLLATLLGRRISRLGLLRSLNILVDIQSQADQLVDPLRVICWLIDGEPRHKQRRFIQERGDGLDGAIALAISLDLLLQLLDDRTRRRDLEGLLLLMYDDMLVSRRACAFMMRSMFALQPN